jgi:import inner membrane translocase subunit TIM50
MNTENAIVMRPWKGEPGDKGLIELIPFLECEFPLTTFHFQADWKPAAIGIYKPPDIRAILKAYDGKNIPLEYAKKEAENKRQFIDEWKGRGGGKVQPDTPRFIRAANSLSGFE